MIPVTRAPFVFSRTSTCCLTPAVAVLNSHLTEIAELAKVDAPKTGEPTKPVRSTSGPVGLNGIEHKIVRLFGMINTDRIVGPSLLRYIVSRNFSSASTAGSTGLFEPMHEPYGSVIKSLQSRFLNAGLFKIHEDATSVTFSDGTHKLQIVTDRDNLPSEAGYFIDRYGARHCVRTLQKQFNPEAFLKEVGDLRNILDRYGVEDIGKSQAQKEDGIRDYLSLSFRQMISFMDSNKKALSRL